jgi:hypothetical protein
MENMTDLQKIRALIPELSLEDLTALNRQTVTDLEKLTRVRTTLMW